MSQPRWGPPLCRLALRRVARLVNKGVLVRSRGRLGTPITGLRYVRDAYVRSDGVSLIEGVGADPWLFADRALRRGSSALHEMAAGNQSKLAARVLFDQLMPG